MNIDMKTESIIFDMDGTLWDSSESVAKAWNEAISERTELDIALTAKDIQGVMGLTMDVIADRFFAFVPHERRMELMDICAAHENEYLAKHGGRLYDKVEETLLYLKERSRLFIVSNCQSGYIEGFLEYYGLGKYFSGHICWGDNMLKKGDNIKLIMEQNSIENAVYVGDTQGDCDSAYYAGAKFIHAAYGFGTADRFDARIECFSQLAEIF